MCLWWRIGQFAMKTLNLKLARYSFEKVSKVTVKSSENWLVENTLSDENSKF